MNNTIELDDKQLKEINNIFSYAIIKSLYKENKITLIEFKKIIKKLNSKVNLKLN